MEKIKIGYLPFFIKLYDEEDPYYRDPLVLYMNKLIAMLESRGIEVIPADEICRVKEEFDRAAEKFNRLDVDAVVTQHLAYCPSLGAVDALLSLKMPIVIFDTTVDYGTLAVQNYKNCLRPNHGIHGVQDLCNMLIRNGRDFSLCVGHTSHGDVLDRVVSCCRAAKIAKTLKNARIGSVGGAFEGMGDFQVPEERLKAEIGAEIIKLSPEIAEKYLSAVTVEEIDAEIALEREKYDVRVKNTDDYRESTRSGLAMRKWIDENRLCGCTVNFLKVKDGGLPKMPFNECCKMLERGIGYAGEGDVLTAGLAGALFSVFHDTAFVEMFIPDWENGLILLSHMGESNPALAKFRPIVADKPFGYNGTGDTVSMVTCMRAGNAVLVNLAPMKEGFRLILSPVTMTDDGLERGAYEYVNRGWMKPSLPLQDFLADYSEAGGTHHSALVYGGDLKTLSEFGKMCGFEVTVIK